MNIPKLLYKLSGKSGELRCPVCGSLRCVIHEVNTFISNIQLKCIDCQLSGDILDLIQKVRNVTKEEAIQQLLPGGEFHEFICGDTYTWQEWLNHYQADGNKQQDLIAYLNKGNDLLFKTYEGTLVLDKLFNPYISGVQYQKLQSVCPAALAHNDIPYSLRNIIKNTKNIVIFPYKLNKLITKLYLYDVKTHNGYIYEIYKNSIGVFRHDFGYVHGTPNIILADNPFIAVAAAYNYAVGKGTGYPIVHIHGVLPWYTPDTVLLFNSKDFPFSYDTLINLLSTSSNRHSFQLVNTFKPIRESNWRVISKATKNPIVSGEEWLLTHIDNLYRQNKISTIYQLGCVNTIRMERQNKLIELARNNTNIDEECLDYFLSTVNTESQISTGRYTIAAVNNKMLIVSHGDKWLADFVIKVNYVVMNEDFLGYNVTVKSEKYPPVTFILKESELKNKKTLGKAIRQAYYTQHKIIWWEDIGSIHGMSWYEIINCMAKRKEVHQLVSKMGLQKGKKLILPKVSYRLKDKGKIEVISDKVELPSEELSMLYDKLTNEKLDDFPIMRKLFNSKNGIDRFLTVFLCHILDSLASGPAFSHPKLCDFEPTRLFIAFPDLEWADTMYTGAQLLSTNPKVITTPNTVTGLNQMQKHYSALGTLPLLFYVSETATKPVLNKLLNSDKALICGLSYEQMDKLKQNQGSSFYFCADKGKTALDPDEYHKLEKEISAILPELIIRKSKVKRLRSTLRPAALQTYDIISMYIDADYTPPSVLISPKTEPIRITTNVDTEYLLVD